MQNAMKSGEDFYWCHLGSAYRVQSFHSAELDCNALPQEKHSLDEATLYSETQMKWDPQMTRQPSRVCFLMDLLTDVFILQE